MIFHASELATELFDEVQSQRCTFAISIAAAKLPAWSRHVMVTCIILRNKINLGELSSVIAALKLSPRMLICWQRDWSQSVLHRRQRAKVDRSRRD